MSELVRSIETIPAGKATPWITVELPAPDGRSGIFRAYRLDDDVAFLSPVYRRRWAARDFVSTLRQEIVYVADDPSWATDSSRLPEYYYPHVRDLTGARAQLATCLAADDWSLLVYFDSLLTLTREGYRRRQPSSRDQSRLSETMLAAYGEVDARIGALVEAAGTDTTVIIVARQPRLADVPTLAPRHVPVTTGFMLTSGELPETRGIARTSARKQRRLATTVIGLLDLDAPAGRGALDRSGHGNERAARAERGGYPLTVVSLQRLGLLPAPAGSETSEAEAAATANQ